MERLEKLTGFQLVKKLPTFHGTRRLIYAFTSARHLSLPWANSIQSIPPHPTSRWSILILYSHLVWVSQVISFPQVSPPKLCIRLSSHLYALHAPPIKFFSILSPQQYWVRNGSSLCSFLHSANVTTCVKMNIKILFLELSTAYPWNRECSKRLEKMHTKTFFSFLDITAWQHSILRYVITT